MTRELYLQLSRREREIMDALFELEEATGQAVREAMADPPSYSAVRATLRILEDKGFVKHRQDGASYVYSPRVTKKRASRSALRRVVSTFFGGSIEQAIAALLDLSSVEMSDEERTRLLQTIREKEEEGS